MTVTALRRRTSLSDTALRYVPVLVAAAAFALPLLWVVVTSLKKQSEFGTSLLPTTLELANYELAVVLVDFVKYATNSLVLSGAYAVIVVLVSALVGYGFARHRGPGRERLFMLVLATLMVPGLVLFVPQFVMFARLEITNT